MSMPQIQELRARLNRAETAEEHAEICRLEAEIMGGPFYCAKCGVKLYAADTAPCDLDHGDCDIARRRT